MSRNVTRLVLNPVAACAARCRRMLAALARLGKRRMGGLMPSSGVVPAASAFSRMARALRFITLLELRLHALLARGPMAPTPAPEAAPCETERLHDPEDRDESRERDPIERPDRESPDRESFPAFEFDKMLFEDARPLGEIVAAICRDLGLSQEATLRAQAPFAALEALLAGKPPPPERPRRHWDRAPPGAPFLRTSEPSDAKDARLEARGPSKPP